MLSRFDDYPIHQPFHQHAQILIGPHAGYGFSGLVDGAPAPGLAHGARLPGPQATACS